MSGLVLIGVALAMWLAWKLFRFVVYLCEVSPLVRWTVIVGISIYVVHLVWMWR